VERAPHVDRAVDDRATDDEALHVGPTEWEERQRAREAELARERIERVEREERRRGLIVVASAIILIALLVLFVNVRGGSDPGVDPAPRAADQPPVDVPAEMPVVDVVTPVSQLAFADRAAADVRDAPPRGARPGAVRPPARPQVRVVLDADVLFPKDSPVLRPLAHQRLRQLAAAIARRGPGSVLVVGYTDDLGTAQHGLVLSRRRAAAVSAVLRPVLPVAQYPFAVAGPR
jgi:outer membrane protein OmpA-like peptidoglycan-associated protein